MSQPAFDFDDAELDDGGDPTFSVCELAEAINDQFRRGFRDGVWVRGEINGLQHRGPHTYFSLVEDGDDGKGVLRVQLFAPAKRRLTPILKRANLDLRDGMKVRIRGFLDYWAPGRLRRPQDGRDRPPVHARRDRPVPRRGDAATRGERADRSQQASPDVTDPAARRCRHQRRLGRVGRLPPRTGVQRVRLRTDGGRHPRAGRGRGSDGRGCDRDAGPRGAQGRPRRDRRHPRRRRPQRVGGVRQRATLPTRSPPFPSRSSPGSATRSIAASPTRWPTRRSRPRPRAPVP